MKIVIDARTLGQKPSGVGIYTARFARALAQEPDVALCLVTDVCESAEMLSLAEEGIPVLRFGRAIRKGPDLWRYFAFLKRVIREEKPDIFWEVNNLLPIRLKNPYGKYVVTLHDIFPITMPAQHGMIFRLYFRYGLKKTLRRLLDECECHVAVSLHSPIHEQRLHLMPAERQMPIADIVALLREYDWSHQRRITFEYTMFGGTNDSTLHAKELTRLLRELSCRVNLIRWHRVPDVPLQEVETETMEHFRDYLCNHGIPTTIRASRGQDIEAACGLLKSQLR